jgi:hypothetical protein
MKINKNAKRFGIRQFQISLKSDSKISLDSLHKIKQLYRNNSDFRLNFPILLSDLLKIYFEVHFEQI